MCGVGVGVGAIADETERDGRDFVRSCLWGSLGSGVAVAVADLF
jgi:hypothetical protein